jgi:hypothetical protein
MIETRPRNLTGATVLILVLFQLIWMPVGAAVQISNSKPLDQQLLRPPMVNPFQEISDVKFLMRTPEYTTYYTTSGMILAGFTPQRRSQARDLPQYFELQILLRNVLRDVEITTLNPRLAKPSRFSTNEPVTWLLNLPTYAKVKYSNLYPEIDMVCVGNQRQLEFEFVVAPGGDPRQIQFHMGGAERVQLTPEGALLLKVQNVAVELPKPVAYQAPQNSDAKYVVDAHYVLIGKNQVGLEVGPYDSKRTLIIDR